ncbi:hypothetical protein LCGC14_3101520 [marine sediment metagenome]|uniref:Uncharacterized protein n=1 Tax=marine sediment metagenome TaxID=412755 RepID=A0A0F8YXP1_9ZZZZ
MHVLASPRIRRRPRRSASPGAGIPFEDRYDYNARTGLFEPRVFNRALAVNQLIGFGAGGGAGFLPTDLLALILWLDSTDTATITLNGPNVSQWDDKSPKGFDFAEGTAGNQPLFIASGINGLGTVSFDGGTEKMTSTALASTVQSYTAYFGLDQKDESISWQSMFCVSTEDLFFVATDGAGGEVGFAQNGGHKVQADAVLGVQLLSFLLNSSGTSSEMWRNSSSLGTGAYIVKDISGTTRLASNPDADTNEGDYQQVLIYEEAQSAGNRGSVESYLMGRLGI